MSKNFRRFLLGVLFTLFLLVFVYPSALNAAEIQEGLPEGNPAYTLTEANTFMKEVIPLVEEATGKKFEKIPKIKLVDRKKMIPVLQKEFEPQLKNLYIPIIPVNNLKKHVKCILPYIPGKFIA